MNLSLRIALPALLVVWILVGSPSVSATAQAPSAGRCSQYQVLVSRGSGEPQGLGGPGGATVTVLRQVYGTGGNQALPALANTYPARGLDVHHLSQVLNGAGAALHIGKLGAYTDSVKDGSAWLNSAITHRIAECGDRAGLILVGYSQGAQVTADVYQRLDLFDRTFVVGVILYGDPYFRGSSIYGQGGYDSHLHGFLGQRPEFADDAGGRLLSFCNSGDPICQGLGAGRSFAAHNYTKTAEPLIAARYLLQARQLLKRLAITPAPADVSAGLSKMAGCPKPACQGGKEWLSQLDQHYALRTLSVVNGVVGEVGFRPRGDGTTFTSQGKVEGAVPESCQLVGNLRLRRALRTLNSCFEWTNPRDPTNCPENVPCVLTGPADPDGALAEPQRVMLNGDDGHPAALLDGLTWEFDNVAGRYDRARGRLITPAGRSTPVTLSVHAPVQDACGNSYWTELTLTPAPAAPLQLLTTSTAPTCRVPG